MNFYKRYPADYQRKTSRLTLAQHGAYTLLLDELYATEEPIPADIEELFRICRAMSRAEQDAVRMVADRFFPLGEDGVRRNKRAEEELIEAAPAVQAARENGRKGGRPKKPNANPLGFDSGNPVGYETETQDEPSSKAPHSSELREEKEEISEPSVPRPKAAASVPCPYAEIIGRYHEILPELPAVRLENDARKKAMRTFWAWVLTSKRSDGTPRAVDGGQALEWIGEYFRRARQNDFLMGRSGRGGPHANWRPDLEFLLSEKGKKHVIEKTLEAA